MILDYDPITRMKTIYRERPGGGVDIYYEQDVEPALEYCNEKAKDADYTRAGMKSEWLHYGHIPDVIITKWMSEGFNIYEYGSAREAFKRLNRDYPKLKTTTIFHDKHTKWI